MDFLFVIDAPDTLKAYKDTSVAMMRAAQKRGHAVWICEQHSLRWAQGKVAAAAQAKAGPADGKAVYDKTCFACHAQSVAGSPKIGDKAAWAPRIRQGIDTLMQSVLKGKGAMPPKGGNPSLSDAEVKAAVEFLVSQAK